MNRDVCGECWSPKELCKCEIDTLWHHAINASDSLTRYRFAELVAEREREACAKIAETRCEELAHAIRGRR